MYHHNPQFILLVLLLLSLSSSCSWLQSATARRRGRGRGVYTLEMHHRFSDTVRKLSGTRTALSWPHKRTVEYYALLATHDRLQSDALTFSDGNATFRITSLGFLHYTSVTLGTPGMKFLVALDTGSDIFWVPCRCTKCASIHDSPYTSDFELSIYDPDGSSTSKNVSCSNDLCAHHDTCSVGTSSNCPYYVSYVSSETSTSGILVEDILHLRPFDDDESVKAYVTFGCGQVQTGSFLDVAAPNGLFGLGFEKISVPSTLFREGYIENSFSMCFGNDGVGRISFGDKGSLDQEETPFIMHSSHSTYNITVTQVRIGTTLLDTEFTALFDSGTSFTYLVDPCYTQLSENFHSHVHDERRPPDPRIPFEYCYIMSPDTNTSMVPGMSLTMDGGGQLVIYDPVIVISTLHELAYCLAVIKSQELNIIGQNFMTGYRIVFDREKLVLGWKKVDCYDDMGDANTFDLMPANYASAPSRDVVGSLNHTIQHREPKRNTAKKLVTSSFYRFSTSILIHSLLVSAVLAFQ